jgi:hypothetical protein
MVRCGRFIVLPLFMAAGVVMFPTVVGGGLAQARVHWPLGMRAVCLLAAAAPVALVSMT